MSEQKTVVAREGSAESEGTCAFQSPPRSPSPAPQVTVGRGQAGGVRGRGSGHTESGRGRGQAGEVRGRGGGQTESGRGRGQAERVRGRGGGQTESGRGDARQQVNIFILDSLQNIK